MWLPAQVMEWVSIGMAVYMAVFLYDNLALFLFVAAVCLAILSEYLVELDTHIVTFLILLVAGTLIGVVGYGNAWEPGIMSSFAYLMGASAGFVGHWYENTHMQV